MIARYKMNMSYDLPVNRKRFAKSASRVKMGSKKSLHVDPTADMYNKIRQVNDHYSFVLGKLDRSVRKTYRPTRNNNYINT